MMNKLLYILLTLAICWFAAYVARAQDSHEELAIPAQLTAGQGMTIPTSGTGEGTFYLIGPGGVLKRSIRLGQQIRVVPEDMRPAGRYIAVLRSGESSGSKVFFVTPAQPAALNFLARPSRVPTAT